MTLITKKQDVKVKVLKCWARERGMMQDNGGQPDTIRSDCLDGDRDGKHRRDQSQLYLLLYIEKLVRKRDFLAKNTELTMTRYKKPPRQSTASYGMRMRELPVARWTRIA